METAILLTAESFIPDVDRWRQQSWLQTDPPLRLSEAVPPHLTLLWPWQPHPSAGDAWQRLGEAVDAIPPFEVRFRTVGQFDNGLVFLEPDASSELEHLFAKIVGAFPEFPPYGGQFDRVHLHLTVSPEGGPEVAAEVRTHDLDLRLPVTCISVWSLLENGRWTTVRTLPLGPRAG